MSVVRKACEACEACKAERDRKRQTRTERCSLLVCKGKVEIIFLQMDGISDGLLRLVKAGHF